MNLSQRQRLRGQNALEVNAGLGTWPRQLNLGMPEGEAPASHPEASVAEIRAQKKPHLGGSVHDPTVASCCSPLAVVAEFEADLARMRTREGMRVAKANGRLRGKQPNSTPARRRTLSRCTRSASSGAGGARFWAVSSKGRLRSPVSCRPGYGPRPEHGGDAAVPDQ
jgi:hypothetical protein